MYVFMLLLEMVYWKLVLFVIFDEFFIFGNFLFVFFVEYKSNINMDWLKVKFCSMLKYFLKVCLMYIVCIEVLGNGFYYENLIVVCEVS